MPKKGEKRPDMRPRDKFWVWQIASFLYFSNIKSISKAGLRTVVVDMPSFVSELRIRRDRLLVYMSEAEKLGLIEEYTLIGRHSMSVKLKIPPNLGIGIEEFREFTLDK